MPREEVMDFDRVLGAAMDDSVSDMHLQAALRPVLQVGDQIRIVERPPLADEDMPSCRGSIPAKWFLEGIASH
jgi:Tfp pilus assembly pilus retraction ATPase PilT